MLDRLAVTNARRLRAASDAASIAKSEADSEEGSSVTTTSMSEEDLTRTEEPFIIVSQEIFLEHQSGITHAQFSCEGTLISSCDAENIVRIWTYNGSSSMPPAKISNTSNILSLAWETRDRYVSGKNTGSRGGRNCRSCLLTLSRDISPFFLWHSYSWERTRVWSAALDWSQGL